MAVSTQVDLLEPINLSDHLEKVELYLETVMLIKQAKDKGLNLGAAIEAARRFRELNPRTRATEA
jgi:hypothetical protein